MITFGNMKNLIFFLLPFYLFAQEDSSPDRTIEYLTADTWNISYNITPDGERIEEQDQEKIKSNWVVFRKDGKFEMPGGISGKTFGKWSYDPSTKTINFTEGNIKYKAIVEEISDMNLLLNYAYDGGFKIGLIHYVFIPKPKSEEEIVKIITSGRWSVIVQFFDNIEDKTPPDKIQDTWIEFYENNTYQRSEYTGEDEPTVREGTWSINNELMLNLDGNEVSTYSVAGDNSSLMLTSNADGIRIINCRKAK